MIINFSLCERLKFLCFVCAFTLILVTIFASEKLKAFCDDEWSHIPSWGSCYALHKSTVNQHPPVNQLAVLSTELGWIFHLLPKPVLINHHGTTVKNFLFVYFFFSWFKKIKFSTFKFLDSDLSQLHTTLPLDPPTWPSLPIHCSYLPTTYLHPTHPSSYLHSTCMFLTSSNEVVV